MIGHVALQRCYRNIAVFDRAIIRSVLCVGTKVLLSDPELWLAARIDVLSDNRARVLNSLTRDLDALDFAQRHVDVQESSFGQSLAQNFSYSKQCESCSLGEVKVLSGHQADGYSRNAQDRCLKSTSDCPRVRRIISEIAAMVDAGDTNMRQLILI